MELMAKHRKKHNDKIPYKIDKAELDPEFVSACEAYMNKVRKLKAKSIIGPVSDNLIQIIKDQIENTLSSRPLTISPECFRPNYIYKKNSGRRLIEESDILMYIRNFPNYGGRSWVGVINNTAKNGRFGHLIYMTVCQHTAYIQKLLLEGKPYSDAWLYESEKDIQNIADEITNTIIPKIQEKMLTKDNQLYIAHCDEGAINLCGKMANRHGLVAGAAQGRIDDVESGFGDLIEADALAQDGLIVVLPDILRDQPDHALFQPFGEGTGFLGEGFDGGNALHDHGGGLVGHLAAVGAVALDAVVLAGIVGRGDHDAAAAAEAAHRVGEHGCGSQLMVDIGLDAVRGKGVGADLGKEAGIVARIVADGAALGKVGRAEPCRHAEGGSAHGVNVEAVGTGAHHAAKTGGAELKRSEKA